VPRDRLGVGSAVSIDATGNVRLGYVIAAIGARPFWERYGLNGDHSGHTADVLGVGVPFTLRVLQYTLWVPYLAVTPQLVYSRVRANVGVAEGDATGRASPNAASRRPTCSPPAPASAACARRLRIGGPRSTNTRTQPSSPASSSAR
jgi:hypothetical protein